MKQLEAGSPRGVERYASSHLDDLDSFTLASMAVQCLALVARRKRGSRLADVYVHAREGASMVESLLYPEDRPRSTQKRVA